MPEAADMTAGPDPFDDDTAWLAADFVPSSSPSPALPLPPTPPIEPALGVHAWSPPHPATAAPRLAAGPPIAHAPRVASTSAPTAPPSTWMAIGAEFQPLPGGPLLTRTDTVPPAALAIAEPGVTVHAVLAGTLHRSGLGMELRADDGKVVGYRGDAIVHWTAGDGERLPAGAIIGWVSAPEIPGTLSCLTLYLQGADGVAVDPVGWLAGLADPRELGLSGGIAGGVDPFLIDLRLAGHLDGPEGAS